MYYIFFYPGVSIHTSSLLIYLIFWGGERNKTKKEKTIIVEFYFVGHNRMLSRGMTRPWRQRSAQLELCVWQMFVQEFAVGFAHCGVPEQESGACPDPSPAEEWNMSGEKATSPCNKFQANIFNKSKCQNCFKSRELHLLNDRDMEQVTINTLFS